MRFGTTSSMSEERPAGAEAVPGLEESQPSLTIPTTVHASSGQEEMMSSQRSNVLLITVIRPARRITTDFIHHIFKNYGNVLRIVVFKRNEVKAIVEFDSIAHADAAKQNLHNCNIYDGCCTLKIDFARHIKTLTVYKNDADTCDYTNPGLNAGMHGPPHGRRGTPGYHDQGIQGPPQGRRGTPGYHDQGIQGPPQGHRGPYGYYDPAFGPGRPRGSPQDRGDYRYGGGHEMMGMRGPPQGRRGIPGYYDQGFGPGWPGNFLQDQGDFWYGGGHEMMGMQVNPNMHELGYVKPVLRINNMSSTEMNCDKLFNLLCLYGNVLKIKFLRKPGCALVEMGDAMSVMRAITNLSNNTFFSSSVQLSFTELSSVVLPRVPGELPDGTPSCMDYTWSHNNRFRNEEAASKNRPQPTSNFLHFFNAHPDTSPQTIKQVFVDAGATEPVAMKMFKQGSDDRRRRGLIEWTDQASAVEALCLANHANMESPGGKRPYILKLCFSNNKSCQTGLLPF